jgi:hypothetical protein
MRYRSCGADDGDLRSRLRELARQRRRFGYQRLHILLRRDGITINHKKTQRLYREEGLTVRRRKGRKRAVGVRAPASVLALPNQRWSLGFVHDQLVTGRRLRVLNRPWINGQIERINQTIKEATVKHFHYESHEQLRMHLAISWQPTTSPPGSRRPAALHPMNTSPEFERQSRNGPSSIQPTGCRE